MQAPSIRTTLHNYRLDPIQAALINSDGPPLLLFPPFPHLLTTPGDALILTTRLSFDPTHHRTLVTHPTGLSVYTPRNWPDPSLTHTIAICNTSNAPILLSLDHPHISYIHND